MIPNAFIVLSTASCWIRRSNRWAIFLKGLVVVLVIATGFWGGIIADG